MIEVIFKALITSILGVFIVWMWQSHIDVKATFVNLFKNKVKEQTEWISTRQEDGIYQNNQLVGEISGTVNKENDKIVFDEISNTGLLNKDIPFEYKRIKCKIIGIESVSGMKVSNEPGGNFTQKSNVLEKVTCEKTLN